MADCLYCLGVTTRRRFEGDTDKLFSDAPRPVHLVDDQGVNGDEAPCPLELTSSGDRNEADDLTVRLGNDNLSRW